MMASLVGSNAAVSENRLWSYGNLVLAVESQNLTSEVDLRALVKSLDGHADKTPLPEIRSSCRRTTGFKGRSDIRGAGRI